LAFLFIVWIKQCKEDNAPNGKKYEASWLMDQSFNMQSTQG